MERQNTTRASDHRADLIANVRIGEEVWTIVAEYNRRGQPRQVREAVFQLFSFKLFTAADALIGRWRPNRYHLFRNSIAKMLPTVC